MYAPHFSRRKPGKAPEEGGTSGGGSQWLRCQLEGGAGGRWRHSHNQPTNVTTNFTTNQPTNQRHNQPTNQPYNVTTNVTTNQPTSQPTNRQTKKPIDGLGTLCKFSNCLLYQISQRAKRQIPNCANEVLFSEKTDKLSEVNAFSKV